MQILKKIAAISILIIYAASITGFGAKTFYCCNKLQSVTAILLLDKSERGDGDKKEPGCCKTKYSFFKVKDSHKSGSEMNSRSQAVAFALLYVAIPPVYHCFSWKILPIHYNNGPPLSGDRPSFKMNCIYRI